MGRTNLMYRMAIVGCCWLASCCCPTHSSCHPARPIATARVEPSATPLPAPTPYRRVPQDSGSARVWQLDFMKFPLTIQKDDWLRQLQPLDGHLVEVIGCPFPLTPFRQWSEGFLLWPKDHCPHDSDSPKAGYARWPRLITVRLAAGTDLVEEKTALRLVRIRGKLRLGDVMDGQFLEAWGDIVDAHVEVLGATAATK
jgi:hypothetical protein